jgi:DNA-binding MarR family transcriptional regulator
MAKSAAHQQTARDVWRLLFDTFMLTYPERQNALAEHGLTPNDSRALYSLDRKAGQPIGALAKRWACDPSTATWVVDRLERVGMAERRPSPDDRRVKLVLLTAKGEKTITALNAAFNVPPPSLEALSDADLGTLRTLLGKLVSPR